LKQRIGLHFTQEHLVKTRVLGKCKANTRISAGVERF